MIHAIVAILAGLALWAVKRVVERAFENWIARKLAARRRRREEAANRQSVEVARSEAKD